VEFPACNEIAGLCNSLHCCSSPAACNENPDENLVRTYICS
jgi:hypothetical protein